MVSKLKLNRWTYGILLFAILLVLFLVPVIVTTTYYLHLIIFTLIWVVMTSGLNVIQGYAGYVSLSQSAFYGLGAYTTGLLMTKLGWSFGMGMIAAVFIGLIIGTLIGLPTLKTKGHYFSIATMAFTMLLFTILRGWNSFTHGIHGFAIPILKGEIFGYKLSTREGYYYIVLIFSLLTILFVKRLFNSRTGRAIVTIRENENLAKAIGINTVAIKILAFDISAILGCIGGVLYAHYMNYVNPTAFGAGISMNAILAVMIGGAGTVFGPVIGSLIVTFLPEILRIAAMYRQLIFGVLLILIVFVMPNGVIPPLSKLFAYVCKKVLGLFKKVPQQETIN